MWKIQACRCEHPLALVLFAPFTVFVPFVIAFNQRLLVYSVSH